MIPDSNTGAPRIHAETILRKTRRGYAELANQETFLHPKLRNVLLLVDGAASVSEILARTVTLGDVTGLIIELHLQGLITGGHLDTGEDSTTKSPIHPSAPRPNLQVVPATTRGIEPDITHIYRPQPASYQYDEPQAAPAPASTLTNNAHLQVVISALVDDMQRHLGKDAARIVPKIQACKNNGELLMLIVKLRDFLVGYAGREKADAFLARFQKLLG